LTLSRVLLPWRQEDVEEGEYSPPPPILSLEGKRKTEEMNLPRWKEGDFLAWRLEAPSPFAVYPWFLLLVASFR